MVQTSHKTVPNMTLGIWLFIVSFFIAVMVVFGGYVRLTRSGLSMVEWHVVTGIIPPLSESAWQETFEKYQLTPEYQKINVGMTLQEYKFIYYMEYFHRVLGRLTGLILVVPMMIFLVKGTIPRREIPIYLIIGLLFALQGFMGWYMVSSGLIDQPHVSHYRLTTHLLFALLLLALCFWMGLKNVSGYSKLKQLSGKSPVFRLLISFIVVLVIQSAYGGLVAGLKAGYVSNTFPLMFGYLIPPGMLSSLEDLVANSVTVHFLHRWFAFVVLAFSAALYYVAKKEDYPQPVQKSTMIMVALVGTQILFGIGVIFFQVPISLALIHQGFALVLFVVAIFINYQLRHGFLIESRIEQEKLQTGQDSQ